MNSLEGRLVPAVTGTVFQDFNGNGILDTAATIANQGAGTVRLAVDRGLAGITVTGFDAAGASIGSVVTAANGSYTLPTPGPGQYRVQFSNIPAGFFDAVHASTGTFSGTTAQFVANGGTANLGLVNPTQYSPDNPELFGVEAIHGDPTGPNGALFEILNFNYSSGATHPGSTVAQYSNPAAHSFQIPYAQVGSVNAITYDRANDRLYAAAFTKKFTGYGPGANGYPTGPNAVQGSNGAIYAINPTTGAVSLVTDFNAAGMFPGSTGTNFRTRNAAGNPYNYTTDGLNTGWDAVGKTAFGGLDVSSDGKTLFVMNLGDRQLYAVPLTGPINNTTVKTFSLLPALPADVTGVGGAGGALGDLRPFAVRVRQEPDGAGGVQDYVYVGAVNSAESTQQAADLHGYVFRFDPVAGGFTTSPATGTKVWFEQAVMTYNRGAADLYRGASNDANWHPWTASFVQQSPHGPVSLVEAQPWLTDLAFDAQGNLTLGYRDRAGDQSTNDTGSAPYANQDGTGSNTRYEGYPDGEALRAFGTPATGWVLESNGKGPGGTPAGSGVGNGFGPGGGQYYGLDSYAGGHEHIGGGMLLQLPGYPDLVVGGFDPTEIGGDFRTGGFRWFDNRNTGTNGGAWDKSYQLYSIDQAGTFQKENGIGGIAARITSAPVEMGDRVWRDTNGNGLQDAGEPGIPGVTVDLFDPAGNLIDTAVTDANGYYLFSGGAGTTTPSARYGLAGLTPDTTGFTVRLDNPADYAAGGPLAGLLPTRTAVGAGTNADIDSNGVVNAAADIRAGFNTGDPGTNDHTVDFGFEPTAQISGVVFDDTAENDGLFQAATDPGINGVTVTLTGIDDLGNPVNLQATTANINGQDGAYGFAGLRPSDGAGYTVTETGTGLPATFVDGKDSPPGSLGGTLAGPFADQVQAIPVAAGDNGTGYNFGEIRVPDLTIAKVHNGTFRQGDPADTYSLTVQNVGFAPTNGVVTVTDTLPAGLSPTPADVGTINGWTVSVSGQTITATRSDVLAAGSSFPVLTLTVAVANNAPASITNTATVGGGGEQDLSNDSAGDTVSVGQVADLTITKLHNGTFRQGDLADLYTLTVHNAGPGDTTGTVTVTDVLPAGLSPTGADTGTVNGWTLSTSGQTVTATRSDVLAAGASYPALLISVAVANNAPASITNTATVGGGGELDTSNDSGSDTTPITQAPDLVIAKVHNGTFRQGDAADTYTLTVSNTGPGDTASPVTVTDVLPAGLSPTAADTGTVNGWTLSTSGQTITATRSDVLTAGASYPDLIVTVAVANNAPASITNTATVAGGGENDTSNDSGSDTTPVTQVADLVITKLHNGTFRQGDAADTYTLTVSNTGPGATTGPVTVTDTLPVGLTPTAADTGTVNGWTLSTNGQTVTATRSDVLAAGAAYPALTLTVAVANNAPASITNTATVGGGGELNTGNDSGSDTTPITQVADLVIAKVHNGTFRQGDAADTYTLTVSNTGPGATTGTVTISDTLPAGLTPTAANAGTINGWTVATTGQTVTATRSDVLAAGGSYPDLTITVAVANNAPASITNTATVAGGGELNTANDSGADTVTVTQVADLVIAKIHNGTFRQGDSADTYTLTVSNTGPGPTTGTVTVTDTLPAGLSPTPADTGTINGWNLSTSGQTVTATRSDVLAAGASYPALTLTVAVASNAPASITNTASVSGGGELNTGNDSGSDTTPITQVADLVIAKMHNGTFRQGDTADTYTLTVSNTGPGPTTGLVTVTDTLPAGLSPTAADTGTVNGWTLSTSGQTVTATRSDVLAAGASYPPLVLTVAVANDAPASITNTATVGGGGELNTANDSGGDTVAVTQVADLVIAKIHNGAFRQTDPADTYTLTVSNTGPGPTTGTVTVTDTLPAGLSPTAADNATINGWTVHFTGQTVTATRSDVLAAGASYPVLTITVAVARTAPASITNTATVGGGGELNTANDTGTDTVSILPPPVTIGQVLWRDRNGNGIQDPGEPGIAGVTVHLYSTAGKLLATAITDAAGHYSFSDATGTSTPSAIFNLAAVASDSHYTIRLDNPADLVGAGPLAHLGLTSAFVGGNPQVNSKARAVGGVPTIDVQTGPPLSNTRIFNAGFVDPRDPGILTKRRFIH